jgi:hypothetical protein
LKYENFLGSLRIADIDHRLSDGGGLNIRSGRPSRKISGLASAMAWSAPSRFFCDSSAMAIRHEVGCCLHRHPAPDRFIDGLADSKAKRDGHDFGSVGSMIATSKTQRF